MIMENGLSIVTVSKKNLLTALKKNRDAHRSVFERALKGYRIACIKELDSMLKAARAGRQIRKVVQLDEPSDHTRDYDRIIRMLEMSIDVDMKITEEQFSQYVLDDWAWKRQFIGTTSNYMNSKRGR